ncbi:MATE family efflux transporter [Marasmitruncus massiliensis]|uniref:MATE family efflux transporter n=1 Tax=Marasmitruncus massiliensis TaxID=1944642 RepID=UPI0015E07DCD|nr:MATE family efflux transporter [Marasmitruncus massiliensis]
MEEQQAEESIYGKDRAQYERMVTAPIPGLILSLAVPTIISMTVTALYNMADTFFVSQLGTSASGAVGIVFSLMAMIQAVGFTLGMGSGSIISRLLGRQEREAASQIASSAFFAAIGFGLLLTIFGLGFLDGLMHLLGTTDTILPYARDYARYILLGAPIMCGSFVMNNHLRAQGKAALSMVGLSLGGVLNIALDPLFIFTFGLGISGAAIATLISQCISFSILLSFFLRGKSVTVLHIKKVSRSFEDYADIIHNGLPSLCRQGLASAATVALNISAAAYGDPAVAAMSIVSRIFLFILSVMLGIGQGFQPVAGYNYGAGQYARVRQAYWFTVRIGMIVMTTLAAAGFFFAPDIISLFRRGDAEVIAIGVAALRWQCIALPLQPVMMGTNMVLQSVGKANSATFLACNRQGVFFLPLILLLPKFLGLAGIEMSQALADAASFAACLPYLYFFFRELHDKEATGA